MKELEQKAKRLIDTFRRYVDDEIDGEHAFQYSKEQETKNATQCAIQSVNHAIYTLKKLKKVMAYKVDALNIEEAINEQIELKKILESRL
jgi:hypothetical protein